MRKLTVKQKNILKSWGDQGITILSDNDLTILEGIHDYETLWQDAQRFLHDNVAIKKSLYSFF